MKYLVLDTNVYLHYKDFEQVDWKTLVGDDVTLCVPMIVLGEIDKHKDQGRGKIQKRAKKLSSRFSELFLQGEKAKIAVEEVDNPPSTAFDDTRFHKDINDDWVILSALHASHDTSSTVIVSGDNGILLKAKHFGLGFYKMPDDLLLSVELSEEEKEIKKLREQLAKHEARLPNPVVQFKNQTDRLVIDKPEFVNLAKELETYKTQLKAKYPYKSTSIESYGKQGKAIRVSSNLDYSTIRYRDEYNEELDGFFEKKVALKQCELLKQLSDQRFVRIDFWLGNTGTSSLGDTMVFVTFPSDVLVYDENSKQVFHLEDPKEPKLKSSDPKSFVFPMYSTGKTYKDIEIWDIEKPVEDHEFKYESNKLIHNLCEHLGSENPVYVDIAKCGNFTINWTVFDSKLIEPVSGELHVIIEEAQARNCD